MNKLVWVEIRRGSVYPGAILFAGKDICRIFRSKKAAFSAACTGSHLVQQREKKDAIAAIRHQVFLRSKGDCEFCASPVIESSGHLHEKKHRGQGGEISLENSVFICAKCHQQAHKARNPQWRKK